MIHHLLSLTRPLFVLDTETTGVDPQKDRIVELGFQQWDATGMTKEWRTLVNPGVPIPAGATKVHGITDEDIYKCQTCHETILHGVCKGCVEQSKRVPRFRDLAASLAKGFSDCDFAGKNVRFDLRITAAEMVRAGQPWDYSKARIVDADRLEALLNPRSLSHLYEKYTGEKHDEAHGAIGDVKASRIVIEHQFEARGVYLNSAQIEQVMDALEADGDESNRKAAFEMIQEACDPHVVLPRDLDALHNAQWPGWIDGDGKFRFIDGVACFSQWGKFANKPMRSADGGYWDFILKSDFSSEVKALASAAKLGQFPEAR